ncbi:MAG TPA: alanyl-tRNA editing protein [Synergistaceae bacterium]|nr:alanyl-tRNA editing protein [Synergistaceae bacterium]HPQ37483.1 alanyl-tRNA editing protein [Synergistaceae bacterium]
MEELQTMRTRILEVVEAGKKRGLLRLEQNFFRVAGGGQPGDRGKLEGEDFRARVVDCRHAEKGVVVEVAFEKGSPREGLEVWGAPDLEVRRRYSRMHSGEHILSRILENSLEGLHVYKVAIGEDESSVSFTYHGDIDWEILFSAEEKAREIISRDLPVTIRTLSREEAQQLPSLKANWDRIEDTAIRVVEIPDFDCIACSGSHVSSTAEVGDLLITGYNGSSPEWSLKFRVEGSTVEREYGRIMRRLVRHIGCAPEKLEQVVLKMQEEKEELSRLLGKTRNYLSFPWEKEPLDESSSLHWIVLAGVPRDMVAPDVKRHISSCPGDVVLALLPREEGKSDFLLARGENSPLDCRELLRDPSLGARGGGASEWVSGVAEKSTPETWKKLLHKFAAADSRDS